ncbi:hypothetical protein ACLMJK_001813 [Lecanora helva]
MNPTGEPNAKRRKVNPDSSSFLYPGQYSIAGNYMYDGGPIEYGPQARGDYSQILGHGPQPANRNINHISQRIGYEPQWNDCTLPPVGYGAYPLGHGPLLPGFESLPVDHGSHPIGYGWQPITHGYQPTDRSPRPTGYPSQKIGRDQQPKPYQPPTIHAPRPRRPNFKPIVINYGVQPKKKQQEIAQVSQRGSASRTESIESPVSPVRRSTESARPQPQQKQTQTESSREKINNEGVAAGQSLSTGEVLQNHRLTKRARIAGFPNITEPLPADIQDEEIITDWPNHLWGPVLLRVSKNYTPKEICNLLKMEEKTKPKPNTFVKRIAAAKKQAGTEKTKRAKGPSKAAGAKRKRAEEIEEAREQAKEEVQTGVEPEASRKFRLQQLEIQREMDMRHPELIMQHAQNTRKGAKRQRDLVDDILEERAAKRKRL